MAVSIMVVTMKVCEHLKCPHFQRRSRFRSHSARRRTRVRSATKTFQCFRQWPRASLARPFNTEHPSVRQTPDSWLLVRTQPRTSVAPYTLSAEGPTSSMLGLLFRLFVLSEFFPTEHLRVIVTGVDHGSSCLSPWVPAGDVSVPRYFGCFYGTGGADGGGRGREDVCFTPPAPAPPSICSGCRFLAFRPPSTTTLDETTGCSV